MSEDSSPSDVGVPVDDDEVDVVNTGAALWVVDEQIAVEDKGQHSRGGAD